jgi:hydroxymethylbilane synthase
VRLRIGTRGSRLALWQTHAVVNALERVVPEVDVEVVTVRTTGDSNRDSPIASLGTAGVFTKRIEEELYEGTVDIAVHSLKDMPTELVPGLTLAAFMPRETPNDALISKGPRSLASLPENAVVASGSLRRRAQIGALRPDVTFTDVRGNIETRLRKFHESEWDAMVLAYAGMHRLELDGEITALLSFEELLPAVGQGIMTVECREDNSEARELLSAIDDADARAAALCERAMLRRLRGGCQVPVGAHAAGEPERLRLQGLVASLDGSQVVRDEITGTADRAAELGTELAERLIARGAEDILAEIREREQ